MEKGLFFAESPYFFHGSPDFPLPGIGRSGTIMNKTSILHVKEFSAVLCLQGP